MADNLTPMQRRQCMARVRSKNTGIEMVLRTQLWADGFRYRLSYKLLGKPDLVFVKAKVAVFVDGCFWHSCPTHGQLPKTNAAFWATKLENNKLRDLAVDTELKALGWTVVRIWEHELKCDVERVVDNLKKIIAKRKLCGAPTNSKKSGKYSKATDRRVD